MGDEFYHPWGEELSRGRNTEGGDLLSVREHENRRKAYEAWRGVVPLHCDWGSGFGLWLVFP